MHLGARGFVHAELIDPESGEAIAMEDGATGELVLTHLRHRAAPLLRFRTRDHVAGPDRPLPVRAHRPAGALHRPHRRHADRARRQRLPLGRARGGERVRARGQRPHPRPAGSAGRQAGAAAAGERRAGARAHRRRDAGRRRSATRLREVLVVQTRVELVPWGSLQRSEYKSKLVERQVKERANAEAPEPGRPPHHDRRRRPADVDRLLGGRARHAVRLRAAQPRQRVARATSTSTRATAG